MENVVSPSDPLDKIRVLVKDLQRDKVTPPVTHSARDKLVAPVLIIRKRRMERLGYPTERWENDA